MRAERLRFQSRQNLEILNSQSFVAVVEVLSQTGDSLKSFKSVCEENNFCFKLVKTKPAKSTLGKYSNASHLFSGVVGLLYTNFEDNKAISNMLKFVKKREDLEVQGISWNSELISRSRAEYIFSLGEDKAAFELTSLLVQSGGQNVQQILNKSSQQLSSQLYEYSASSK